MAKELTLTEAQRLLLGIIESVEAGATTPAQAVVELGRLKQEAKDAGVKFEGNYNLADFERIHENYISQYESSYESSTADFESSYSSSY